MKNYTIDIFRVGRKGRELAMRLEFPREHFTNREYKGILLPALFDLAGEGPRYKRLDAVVMRDGIKVWTVCCDTKVDGSEITAYLKSARPREIFRPLRAMRIAC